VVTRIKTLAALLLASGVASACGSSGGSASTPLTPTGTQLTAPTGFYQPSQKINATSNELTLAWTSGEASFQLVIGSSPGASDVLPPTIVAATTYTWISPRQGGAYYARVAAKRGDSTSPYSTELPLFVLDIRNVIDALFFRSGPMADTPSTASTNPVAGVWADGTRLSVLVSNDAGDTARANAQGFADQYAALVGGAVTASATLTSDAMQNKDFRTLPEFTIGVRVQSGYCGVGPLGCVAIGAGPQPVGPNRAIVTLDQIGPLYLGATAHEMGHAYGMGHVTMPAAGQSQFRFLMNPAYLTDQLSDAEKLAITLAHNAGLRGGWTRNQALAADLVNPYTGASSLSGVRGVIQRPADDALGILSPTWVRSTSSTSRKFSGVQ
jgi:hypothetical protein